MRIYNPTCPHCGSENTHALVASAADKTKAVAAAAAIAVTSLPIIKVDILCEDCGKEFLARGTRSYLGAEDDFEENTGANH